MTLLFTFLWLIYVCDGHVADVSSCDSLPASGFLTTQQIDMICHHRSQWLKDRDEQASKGFLRETTAKQMEYLRDIEQCTRTNCVRNSIRKVIPCHWGSRVSMIQVGRMKSQRADNRNQQLIGHESVNLHDMPVLGIPLFKRQSSKLLRKEIRMLSEEERKKLWAAMSGLKTRLVDNITAWDLHILVHYPDSAPGAHWGPAFLPWHREFLRQFEIALQREEPGVTLPYWDSTIDQGLPEPSDSVLWTDELLGNGNGYVKTGPFKDWDTNVFMPLSQIPVKKLFRSTGGREQDRLLSPRDVEWITSRNNYSQLTFCHDKTFESMHGLSHVWVGGFMFVIRLLKVLHCRVSPNDPMFYMHHAFVDYLWEQFRRRSQTREERETQWAKDTCNSLHGFDEQMKPFRIQNRDGLSNQYTDEWLCWGAIAQVTKALKYAITPFVKRYLDVDLSVHHRLITVSSPYMIFACSRKIRSQRQIAVLFNFYGEFIFDGKRIFKIEGLIMGI
uniref:Tyrosinase_Cu-bd domain-containing protein n=1 Tax=Heterorhabditis bacteriophora TaxID=37862 RepID=A0A1I7XST7_HETBA